MHSTPSHQIHFDIIEFWDVLPRWTGLSHGPRRHSSILEDSFAVASLCNLLLLTSLLAHCAPEELRVLPVLVSAGTTVMLAPEL